MARVSQPVVASSSINPIPPLLLLPLLQAALAYAEPTPFNPAPLPAVAVDIPPLAAAAGQTPLLQSLNGSPHVDAALPEGE
ncbi:hypothetical protein BDV93DRAFT_565885 [Ceratobasidium sp. AG-I]|nr:hypothetical protein BDV93DRAFT_565885 [Ceratobasidium sp. AG-I]